MPVPLIVTVILVLICLGIALYAVNRSPFGQPINWGIMALCCVLAIWIIASKAGLA